MSTELVVLRLLHIVPGAVWVGAAVMMSLIVEPRLKAMGPEVGRPALMAIGKALSPVMAISTITTIVIGFVLVSRTPGRDMGQLFSNGWGWAIGIGMITAFISFFAGLATGVTAARIDAAVEAGEDVEPMLERLTLLGRVSAVGAVIAVGAMSAARFV